MYAKQFVGRTKPAEQLEAVLTGDLIASKLTVQSIEGPGGIGKTCLLDHVIGVSDLGSRNYLNFRIDGLSSSSPGLAGTITNLVESVDKIHEYSFDRTRGVLKAIKKIIDEAAGEAQSLNPNEKDVEAQLRGFLNVAIAGGKKLNEFSPETKRYLDVGEIEKSQVEVDRIVPLLASLRLNGPKFYQRLGFGRSRALRDEVKLNACQKLADAFYSDIREIILSDKPKVTTGDGRRFERLLFIVDDYENLQQPLGEFLVRYFLPSLQSANFESVVILVGRDRLLSTNNSWRQHLKPALAKPISLEPLTREEMDQLVECYGIEAASEKNRVWLDTQGYPFYVELLLEEIEETGSNIPSALMLKSIHDRTTAWMTQQQIRWLELTLFLDDVNKKTLGIFIDNAQEIEDAFNWFKNDGSVRDTRASQFRVREYLRSRLLDYLTICDPDRFDDLQRRRRSAEMSQFGVASVDPGTG